MAQKQEAAIAEVGGMVAVAVAVVGREVADVAERAAVAELVLCNQVVADSV